MKLYIQVIRWGRNRVTGAKSERLELVKDVPCVAGITEAIGESTEFSVLSADENGAAVKIHNPKNPNADIELTLEAGETATRSTPLVFGAGRTYQITLK